VFPCHETPNVAAKTIRAFVRLGSVVALTMLGGCTRSGDAGANATPILWSLPAVWAQEQMPGGTVSFGRGEIEIVDAGGCTLWLRKRLMAPVEISYDVTFTPGPGERVSDLNCFWMAREKDSPAAPYAKQPPRTGAFAQYDALETYYVGYGANGNTTTRFRRYDGTPARPLRPEHDLRDKRLMLEANRTVHLRLVARDGRAEFYRDGEKIFSFVDPAPLTAGWFAFRTVQSHFVIRNFAIRTP
jgi:hypothetical protein